MKPLVSIPCSAWKNRAVKTRLTISACLTLALLAAPAILSAQSSQPSPAKNTKTTKKTEATQSTKAKASSKTVAPKGTSVAHNPAPYRRKMQAETGVGARNEALDGAIGSDSPNAAAAEAYAARAYPAAYVPQSVAAAARQGWANFKASDAKRPKNPGEVKQWTLYPLSTQEFPAVLSFSGRPYYDSGRITALAIAPTCQAGNCRLWLAAAGGGMWRTDDALATNPAWTFISGSFATNAIGVLTYDAGSGTLYAGTGEANASADSEAGFGIYKSTDGGDTWTHLAGQTSVASGTVDCTAVLGTGGVQTAPA